MGGADAHEAIERTCKPLDKSRSVPEREASVCATEVLMPQHMVKRYTAVPHVTLGPAREIADVFTTSVLAGALRFVELTDQCCAVAYSSLGRVHWLKPSATFPDFVPPGRRLDPRSAAFDYHERGTIDGSPQMLTADAWLPRERADGARVQLIEHSAVIAPLGVVFSMLWIHAGRFDTWTSRPMFRQRATLEVRPEKPRRAAPAAQTLCRDRVRSKPRLGCRPRREGPGR